MTERTTPDGGRAMARRLVLPLRRVLAPAALELREQVRALTTEIERLREEATRLSARAEAAEARLAALDARCDELDSGLAESRRLNLRVAELTDVVTELVLPLHDRELDGAALAALRPDTL